MSIWSGNPILGVLEPSRFNLPCVRVPRINVAARTSHWQHLATLMGTVSTRSSLW
eukprot:CAMPEP_0114546766 /NCGR_PEP_ID=MMETSP0114-20121206/4106_1 /TAXON_ID=31324 /ORGANISM="Goniomonas sp, Strain m" /LENGTH=54 /DNA_ID=CAMNT_0001731277 /DNA_START=1560 /DNA_END=1724 /DNA_ORIENTATION=+